MGVDVATYRSRIGCCRQNTGHDVVHFTVNINFSRTVKWLCVLPLLLFVLLMFINQTTLFGKGTYDLNFLDLSISSSVFTGFHLCLATEKKTSDTKCPGAVVFIGLLLIKAGIEANPGPLPKEEETQKQTNEGLCSYTHCSPETAPPMPDVSRSPEAEPQTQDVDRDSETEHNKSNDDRSSETEPHTPDDDGSSETKPETPDTGKSSYKQALERHAVDIRKKMGLAEYFPCKITLEDTFKVSIKQKENTATELPWLLLQEIIMVNFEARDKLPYQLYWHEAGQMDDEPEELSDDDDDADCEIDNDTEFRFNTNILKNHDIFMTVFNCCDHALKQVLVSKLFLCRLAVPLIYPTFQSDSICFSLWPLRCIQLNLKREENMSMLLADHPQQVVSFIRISRPSFSKSTLLNAMLSKESTGCHPTFYGNDCLLSEQRREITDGLVEASWYMPTGKSDDITQSTIMFTNLRGNALNYKKQRNLLTAMSNCLVVTIDCRDIETHLDLLKQLYDKSKSILLLLTGEPVSKKHKRVLKGMETVSLFDNKDKKREKNMATLKLAMRNHISKLLKNCPDTSLGECALLAAKHDIPVDESIKICETSKHDAESLIRRLKDFDLIDRKKSVLPLHGELWMKISECTKDLKRTDTSISQQPKNQNSSKSSIFDKEPIKAKIKVLRQEQLRLGDASLAKMFIQYLEQNLDNEEYISYFIRWIRYLLDNESCSASHTLMPEYHRLLEEQNTLKSQQTVPERKMEELKEQISVAKQRLEDVSIGVDNILRDVGQLYESNRFLNKCSFSDAGLNCLPEIAAKLLVRGYPMQLLDGDAGNIPKMWIEAVFQSCKDLIGDKSVYIISMLGVQSSGKSTFLNCLFGLQFPVSAGRCTKGIYMQMLPVDQTCGLAAEYIIVLDTEGLRSQELDEQLSRDNELATFAVGVANMTVINIKGENTSEVKNMLEIVIHALLRLKLANANLRFNTSCLFVHQNVSAPDASEKNERKSTKTC